MKDIDDDEFEGLVFPYGSPRWVRVTFKVFVYLFSMLVGLGLILLFVWPLTLAAFWDLLAQAAHSPLKRAMTTAALAILGFFLYLARRFVRIWYGAAETITGMVLCWAGLGNVSTSKFAGAASLIAGTYVIVRGLDNIDLGKKERRESRQESLTHKRSD